MQNSNQTHVIVDFIYDFINGSLACGNAENALNKTIEFINKHPEQEVLYICDYHPKDHCSFATNGGTWPTHCVEGTKGASIHENFHSKIDKLENRPNPKNTFYKGRDAKKEEYSGYNAINDYGTPLKELCSKDVYVSGIATEYCVKNTILDLLNDGFSVTLIKDALAYVDYQHHLETLEELDKIIDVI